MKHSVRIVAVVLITFVVIAGMTICRSDPNAPTAPEIAKANAEFATTRTATSSIKTYIAPDGGSIVETINRQYKYKFTDASSNQPDAERLATFLETVDCKEALDEEYWRHTVTVDAWIGRLPTTQKQAWTISQPGEEGDVLDDFYRIHKYGEVDLMPVYGFYSLDTGRRLYSSTQKDLTQIDVPNTGAEFQRYAAIHESESILPLACEHLHKNVIAILQYGSTSRVISRLLIQWSSGNGSNYGGRAMTLRTRYQGKLSDATDLDLWGVDGKPSTHSLSGFSIVVADGQVGPVMHPGLGHQLEIPIVNDRPDLRHARIPAGVTLTDITNEPDGFDTHLVADSPSATNFFEGILHHANSPR